MLERAMKFVSYKAGALIHGERGVVVDVEHLGPYDPNTLEYRMYSRDDYGNLPDKLTIRNPLGQLVERISKPVLEKTYDPLSRNVDNLWVYPLYKPGDNFP